MLPGGPRHPAAAAVPVAWLPSEGGSRRHCSTRAPTQSASQDPPLASPVNVTTFELDETIVKADMAAAAEWKAFGEELDRLRQAAMSFSGTRDPAEESDVRSIAHGKLVAHLNSGFELFRKVGPNRSPVQCLVMLRLDLVVALIGSPTGLADAALREAKVQIDAVEDELTGEGAALADTKPQQPAAATPRAKQQPPTLGDAYRRNEGRLAEVKLLRAQIEALEGNGLAAQKTCEKLLSWIDVDSARSLPFVRVQAQEMKRSVQSALAVALAEQGIQAATSIDSSADARQLCGKAIDLFVASLSAHSEANDVTEVATCLWMAARCFAVVGDAAQARSSCEKFESWVERHPWCLHSQPLFVKAGLITPASLADNVDMLLQRRK